jgi:hypothetical protein
VRRLLCHVRPGDDATLVRERRGTTPLATLTRGRSTQAVTGLPARVYWAGLGCSSEGFPVIAGSMPLLDFRQDSTARCKSAAGPKGLPGRRRHLQSGSPAEPRVARYPWD